MKKIFTNVTILIVIVYVILSSFSNVLATETTYSQYMNEGTATVQPEGGSSEKVSAQKTDDGNFDAILAILLSIINFIPMLGNMMLTLVVNSQNGNTSTSTSFTIQDLIFGKYGICDINIFSDSQSQVNNNIKESVNTWYMTTRNIAIIASLLILIYVGIRMALSTIAADKAKYKKMLVDWLASFVLIFVLHYIIIIAMSLSNSIISLFSEPVENLEKYILDNNAALIWKTGKQLESSILYWLIVWYQIKFFFMYMRRFLSTMFLIIIAPLITITYSIDKIGDNQAQALGTWLKEMLINIFIQPLHIVIYIVFIASAGEIAKVAPIVAVILFGALTRAEKIVKNIFDMRGIASFHSVGEYLKKGK